MVVTDLDGTLANSSGVFSSAALSMLQTLGNKGILRVVATGRSLHTARYVLTDSFPIDFLIFSTGAGILDWKTGKLLHSLELDGGAIAKAAQVLVDRGCDVMVHAPSPRNHEFVYLASPTPHPDFLLRLNRHEPFARPAAAGRWPESASQLLSICAPDEAHRLCAAVKTAAGPLHVCRTTSPQDPSTVWLEVFHPHASKSKAAAWLAERHGIPREKTLALGNDYNDVDLLEWAGESAVVANAPDDLKARFPVVPSNDSDGFSHCLIAWLDRFEAGPGR